MNDSNILVLGGTGAMGVFLVEILADENYHVFVSSRKRRESLKENVSYLTGNAHDISFLSGILKSKKWDAIIDFMQYSTAEFLERYELLLKSTSQYIYLSSSRVYAKCNEAIREDCPRLLDTSTDRIFLKSDDYALAKAKQEDILKSAGGNWTIVRPYISYYEERLDFGFYPKELWLYRVLHNRSIMFPKDVLNNYTTLTYGKDVALGIAALIGKKEVIGQVFHITNNNPCQWKQILNVYKQCLESRGFNFKCKIVEPNYNEEGYIYKYDRAYNRIFDNEKIGAYVDVASFTDPLVGENECINSFLEHPKFHSSDWKIHAYWDRLFNEKTSMSEIAGLKNKLEYILFRYIMSYRLVRKMWLKLKYSFIK